MEQQRPRQHQVVVEPALRDQLGQVRPRVGAEGERQPEAQGHDGEEQVDIAHVVAAHSAELAEENQPEDEVDAVVDEHERDLRQEAGPILHGRRQIQPFQVTQKAPFGA